MRYEPPQVVSVDSVGLYHNLVQDQQATKLLGSRWSGPTPISVKGDGNCLFNAISVALFGHENAYSEIRLKTFFEMSDHAMFYERVHAKTQITAISPTFAQATKHCQQNGNWACAWTFHAASTVIARPIKSVYPVVNGPSDAYIRILNTTFKPRCSRSRQEKSLMRSGGLGVSSFWRPSHFVPLIHMDKLSDAPICIDDFEQFPPLCKTSTPLKCTETPPHASCQSPEPEATIAYSDTSDPCVLSSPNEAHVNESHDSNPKSHVTQDDIVSPVQNISSILEQDVSDMEVTNLSTDVVHPYKNPSTNIVTSFLNVDKLYELATSINPTMSVIPPPPPAPPPPPPPPRRQTKCLFCY